MTQQFMQMFAALQEQTKASFWRSDVLRPLHILFLALATVTIGLAYAKAPDPLIYGIGALLGLVALTEIGGFVYCPLKDPDLLRSERIRMHKMAIEARLIGDETTGLIEIEQQPTSRGKAATPKTIAAHDRQIARAETKAPKVAANRRTGGEQ